MKILKLEIKNINSLQGEHEIDFREKPFHDSSLFAITGPTGSGKSTVLDAITLALFNKIPRLGGISKNEIQNKGAVLTRGQKEAMAAVTFALSDGSEYRSEWSISTNRNGNFRDYEMQLSREGSEEILVEKKSDVPGKNEELIGLKYDQFVKSVMLAQGAFAEFLQVKKNERAALLEKITGTEIYREIGKKVFEKVRGFKAETDEIKIAIQTFTDELLTGDIIEALNNDKVQIETEIHQTEALIKSLDEQIKLKKDIGEEEKKLEFWNEKQNENTQKSERFSLNEGVKLSEHQKVEPFSDNLKEWKRLSVSIEDSARELKEIEREIIKNETDRKNFMDNTSQIIHVKCSELEIETQLAEFERNVLNLQNLLQQKTDAGKALKSVIEAELRPLQMTIVKPYEDFLSDLKKRFNEAEKEINTSSYKDLTGDELQENVVKQEQHLENLLNAKADVHEILQLEKSGISLEAELKELNKSLKELPTQISAVEAQLITVSKDVKILDLEHSNSLLQASLEQHRANLTDGEPCPLCGSLDHPWHETQVVFTDDKVTERNRKKEEEKQLEAKRSNLNYQFNKISESVERQENKLSDLEEMLKLTNTEFSRKYGFGKDLNWDKKITETKVIIDSLEKLIKEKSVSGILNNVIPKVEEMLSIHQEAVTVQKKLKELYSEEIAVEEKVRSLEKKWQQLCNGKRDAENRKTANFKTTSDLSGALNPLQQKLTAELLISGFDSPDTAFTKLLSFDVKQKLLSVQNELIREKEAVQTKLQTIEEYLKKFKEKDSEKTLQDIENEFSAAVNQLKEKRGSLEEIKRKLTNQVNHLNKIENLKAQIAEKEKTNKYWLILNDLIGDATGSKFNHFAQDLTLIQLIQLANLRLEKLSERYLIEKPDVKEDDNLYVIDKDMGGMKRSVKTLSGGETFVISLALALALSDLASSNVQIKSLFIDEGFGTLDPDSLEQVLITLEELQEEGSKMIGVISHVDSLKERITTQIQIIPNGRGFSKIEITGI